ncbi:MAG: T9SS type A sorting domain-containing protein, partial [Ignavibacterium sp.]|nr:T9SS type A sorting domain-containing protein [Ignavibacterium sp.]
IQYDSTGNLTYYSEHHKPEFSITPILFIDTTFFKLDFFVQHEYSHFFSPEYPHQGINFIDSVWMYRYYSNGDSIINISNLLAYNNPSYATSAYHVNFQLDTSLMKKGFNFYYKFLAKDKGIISDYTWSPDSGYYECIWNDPLNAEERVNQFITYHLSQNYPNPFNPTTNIEFRIVDFGLVSLKIYDILGREVATLVNEEKPGGTYKVEFDGSNLASGIYLYKLSTDKFSETKLMSLIK